MSEKELWSGRFRRQLDPGAAAFSSSPEDSVLFRYDVAGSIAHAMGLARAGILTRDECNAIVDTLRGIYSRWRGKEAEFLKGKEDVHMAVESELTRLQPGCGAKLHTGRSRNDQVALDLKLYSRDALLSVVRSASSLAAALAAAARGNLRLVMPGYTHLQHAQPLYLSQNLLSHHWRIMRDIERMKFIYSSLNISPLGAGAIGGSSLPLQPAYTAKLLSFSAPFDNSLDASSDRDFVLDMVYGSCMMALHLSSMAEEIVLWSTSEFNFVSLPETLTTGSSLMPHKKNPDMAELIRGRTGRSAGSLTALMLTMKGIPSGYSRDLQETKLPLFSSVDNITGMLGVMERMVKGARFNRAAMLAAASDPLTYSVEAVDELVRSGVPFREAHREMGEAVAESLEKGESLGQTIRRRRPGISYPSSPYESVEMRSTRGSSSADSISAQLEESSRRRSETAAWIRAASGRAASVGRLLGE